MHATLTQTVMRDDVLLAPPFRVAEEQAEEAFRDGPGAYHHSPIYGQPGLNNPWIRKSHNVYIQETLDRNTDSWLKATRSQSKCARERADTERRYSSTRPNSAEQTVKQRSTRLPRKRLASQFDHQSSTSNRPRSSRPSNVGRTASISSPQGEKASKQKAYSVHALTKAITDALKSEGRTEISDSAVRAAVEQVLTSMMGQKTH